MDKTKKVSGHTTANHARIDMQLSVLAHLPHTDTNTHRHRHTHTHMHTESGERFVRLLVIGL